MHKRWAVSELVAVHHARFLLRPAALEIFLADRSNALLSFASPKVSVVGEFARLPGTMDTSQHCSLHLCAAFDGGFATRCCCGASASPHCFLSA